MKELFFISVVFAIAVGQTLNIIIQIVTNHATAILEKKPMVPPHWLDRALVMLIWGTLIARIVLHTF